MTLTYRFVEDGGYDCMTDAFYIEDPSKPVNERRIATLDLSDFGQSLYSSDETREKGKRAARRIAQQLVDGFNRYQQEVAL